MDKDLDKIVLMIQQLLRILSLKGDTKHTRYLRTAIDNISLYKKLKKKEEGTQQKVDW